MPNGMFEMQPAAAPLGVRNVFYELTARGGPWLVPLDGDGRPFTDPASGLRGKLPPADRSHGISARWQATDADDGVVVSAIAYAAAEGEPILLTTAVSRVLFAYDILELVGPAEARVN